MKKVFSVALIAASAMFIFSTSCKKKDDNPTGNYTCTCIITTSGSADTVVLPENNIAKNTAQSACTQAQSTYTTGGSTATCTFK